MNKENKFKDSEKNNRCFIIGTGTSLNNHDLNKLKNEVTIGVNGLFTHPDLKTIDPNYFVLTSIFEGHKSYYDESDYISWFKEMDLKLPNSTIMALCKDDKTQILKNSFFQNKTVFYNSYVPFNESENIDNIQLDKFPAVDSVSETAIQVAIYLGFKEIFLIGFDHDWFNGIHVHFNRSDYMKHFSQEKSDNIVQTHDFDSEHQMIRHARIFNKYKKLYNINENIYNANSNPKSYVDTFPKVCFNDLFNDNYQIELERSKLNFQDIPSKYKTTLINDTHDLAKIIGSVFKQVLALKDSNENYLVYGYGSVGKIIQSLIPDKIIAFVDITSNNFDTNIVRGEAYAVENLKNMSFDKIIISVIGREASIINHLVEHFDIEKNKIITFKT